MKSKWNRYFRHRWSWRDSLDLLSVFQKQDVPLQSRWIRGREIRAWTSVTLCAGHGISRLFNFVATRYAVPRRKRVPLRHEFRVESFSPSRGFLPSSLAPVPLFLSVNASRPLLSCMLVRSFSLFTVSVALPLLYTFSTSSTVLREYAAIFVG